MSLQWQRDCSIDEWCFHGSPLVCFLNFQLMGNLHFRSAVSSLNSQQHDLHRLTLKHTVQHTVSGLTPNYDWKSQAPQMAGIWRISPILLQEQKSVISQKSCARAVWQAAGITGGTLRKSFWLMRPGQAKRQRATVAPTHCKHSLMEGSNPGTHMNGCSRTHTYERLKAHTPVRAQRWRNTSSQFTFPAACPDAGQSCSLEAQSPSCVWLRYEGQHKGK